MGPEMICEGIKYSISLYVNFKISNVAEDFSLPHSIRNAMC